MTEMKSMLGTVTVPDNGAGSFELLASTPSLDRDGDVLAADGWKHPLPDRIPISMDHNMSTRGVVGSGRPWLDPHGNLRITGEFSAEPEAQRVRRLVTEGHIRGVSVEFANTPHGRDLLGTAIVYAPSNPDARVVSAKSTDTDESPEVKAVRAAALARFDAAMQEWERPADAALTRLLGTAKAAVRAKAGARNSKADQATIQAIHDQVAALGAQCSTDDDTEPDDSGTGADDGANKTPEAVRAKALALQVQLGV
jgi:hypothetical protein